MTNQSMYDKFVEWLRQSWGHLPDSVELMPLTKATYSEEEAELLTGMPFSDQTVEELAALKQMNPQDLTPRLDDLAARGLIFRVKQGETVQYRLPDARFVFLRSFFWAGRDNEQTRSVAPFVNRYYRDGFGDNWKHVHTKGLRALPIQQAIEDPRRVLPYEDVVKVLDDQDRFAVANCACRQRKGLDPDEQRCTHETENCLHFGTYADYIIQNQLGREITREEAERILAEAADAGLVHGISNWQKGVDTICNCCKCCCLYLEAFHVLKHSKGMNHSNYEVAITSSSCKGCGLCVKRCPMDALKLEDSDYAQNKTGKIPVLDPGICIGCGVCAHKCPTESLTLKRREKPDHPPIDVAEQRKIFFKEREIALVQKEDSRTG